MFLFWMWPFYAALIAIVLGVAYDDRIHKEEQLMQPEAVVRTVTTLMTNLGFEHYEPDSTPECLVLRRPDDKMKVWIEQGGNCYIGKTRDEAVLMSDILGARD